MVSVQPSLERSSILDTTPCLTKFQGRIARLIGRSLSAYLGRSDRRLIEKLQTNSTGL
jgi:hypothetical protein